MRTTTLAVLSLLLAALPLRADQKLAGIACRSVHLHYPASSGDAFYNEMKIEQSAAGSYFMVCGWNGGYFGMQELGNNKKVILFSVWDDHKGNDQKSVPDEQRVKLLHKDEKVRVGRFGGEGTGGQSFLDYEWKTNVTYRFLVTATTNGPRTEYSGYFFVPEDKAWKHLVTFSTVTGGKWMSGYYSFVEDFKRDRVSATKIRRASFGNGWARSVQGKWQSLDEARFTADSNPAVNIDAGPSGTMYFLATGGNVTNATTALKGRINAAKRMVTATAPPSLPPLIH